MRAVLVGNQNCGKTTLFNILTNGNQKIGNWPGVTVSKKSGVMNDVDMELIDLPGTYSLSPYSLEEKITYGFLLNEEYDLIINVIDATSLQRGLFLTLELLELKKPMMIVLNMEDKLEQKGLKIDMNQLKQRLNVDVCMISGERGTGLVSLLQLIHRNATSLTIINTKRRMIFDFENETKIRKRYQQVEEVYQECVKQIKRRNFLQEVLDKVLLNRIFAIPIFIIMMFGMYYIAIELFGGFFSNNMNILMMNLKTIVEEFLIHFHVATWLISLICNGVITGVGCVLSFLPQLLIIFFITSLLEASGYLARVSFLFDQLLRKIGLNGKSLIPFILGTGCSVSGIMSSRIIENEKERMNTIIHTPMIPCSAKLPIIALFTSFFFEKNNAIIATSFYFLSIGLIILSSFVLKMFSKKSNGQLYIFEMPEYRLPKLKFLYQDVKIKIIEFIKKAGTVIFLASLLSWFLLSFSTSLEYGVDINESIMAFCGKKVAWLFYPILGTNSWEASVSAIQGLIAKEQVVSSMKIIAGLSENLLNMDKTFQGNGPFGFFTPASAYAFVAFNLFTTPCIAAIASMFKEIKNGKRFIFAILYQFLIGWIVAASLFHILICWE